MTSNNIQVITKRIDERSKAAREAYIEKIVAMMTSRIFVIKPLLGG